MGAVAPSAASAAALFGVSPASGAPPQDDSAMMTVKSGATFVAPCLVGHGATKVLI
jgi:hypothetical protein